MTRKEIIEKIESQRAAIREHIDKYYRYPHEYDKDFALKTIHKCQDNINDLKDRCEFDIDYPYEDDWEPND